MNARFPWADAAMWWAIGGSVATAVVFDLIAVITWAQRVWAKLMEDITQ
jgi:hypothetical protein